MSSNGAQRLGDGILPRILARGFLGQHIAAIPSSRLVVVRFGDTHGADDFERGLVHDVFFAVATVRSRKRAVSSVACFGCDYGLVISSFTAASIC